MEYYFKDIIGKEENICSVKNIEFLINNLYTSDSKTIANVFNKYFINVGSTLAMNMHYTTKPLLYVHSIDNCITIPVINFNQVKTITWAIKNSASGYEKLPASILKQCIDSYIDPFTCLINISRNFSKSVETS